jgi:DTW domain-containing protein
MHTAEEQLTSNTAKLASRALVRSELRIHGREKTRISFNGLVEDGRRSLVLYPSPIAKTLTREFVSDLSQPVNLIVPDASWRQTNRFVRREPALMELTHVKLPPGPASKYILRTQASDSHVCTLEAIARAIGLLESLEAQRELEQVLGVMVERTLWARGLLPASECIHGIPAEAM